MKKIICLMAIGALLITSPCLAAQNGRGGHGGSGHGMSRPAGGGGMRSMSGGHTMARPAGSGGMHSMSARPQMSGGRSAGVPMARPVGGTMRPAGGHSPIHGGVAMGAPRPAARPMQPLHHGRPLPPPMYRPYRPFWYYSPYYSYSYYPYYYTYRTPIPVYYTDYTYYPYTDYISETEGVTPVASQVGTVVVKDPYAGVNTAANVINTAANVASTIKFLTW